MEHAVVCVGMLSIRVCVCLCECWRAIAALRPMSDFDAKKVFKFNNLKTQ